MLNQHEAWGFPSGKQRNVSLEGKAASLSQYSKRDLYAKQKKRKIRNRGGSAPEVGLYMRMVLPFTVRRYRQSQEGEVPSNCAVINTQKRNTPVSETARLVRKRTLMAQPTVISDITAG